MSVNKQLPLLALIGIGLLVLGCATTPKTPRMALDVEATSAINPDLQGRPSPVVLYIFTLKGSSIFTTARFRELYSNAKDTLGGDMLEMEEMTISPGETLELAQRELPAEARHIGVIAAFRDMDSATWRGLIDIEPEEKFGLRILVDALTLRVEKR